MTSNNQTEIWRPVNIEEYRDAYEVSNQGRIRRSKGVPGTRAGYVLKPINNGNGYFWVGLSNRHAGVKEQKAFYVHRLVAVAFLGHPPSNQHQVAHSNGNRSDNRAANIRWATVSDNSQDKNDHGTMMIGEGHTNARLKERDFPEMIRLRKYGISYSDIARNFGVSEMTVWNALNGKTWRHMNAIAQLG